MEKLIIEAEAETVLKLDEHLNYTRKLQLEALEKLKAELKTEYKNTQINSDEKIFISGICGMTTEELKRQQKYFEFSQKVLAFELETRNFTDPCIHGNIFIDFFHFMMHNIVYLDVINNLKIVERRKLDTPPSLAFLGKSSK
jgi:adenosine deaminase